MNCKPRDVCVVVSVDGIADLKHLLGAVRRVRRVVKAWDGAAWKYEGERFLARGMVCDAIPDRWLRPITPPPGTITETEVTALYTPTEIKRAKESVE